MTEQLFFQNAKRKQVTYLDDLNQEMVNFLLKNGWGKAEKDEAEQLKSEGWTFITEAQIRGKIEKGNPLTKCDLTFYFKNETGRIAQIRQASDFAEASNLRNSGFWDEISRSEFLRFQKATQETDRREKEDFARRKRKLIIALLLFLAATIIGLIFLGRAELPDLTISPIKIEHEAKITKKRNLTPLEMTVAAIRDNKPSIKEQFSNLQKKVEGIEETARASDQVILETINALRISPDQFREKIDLLTKRVKDLEARPEIPTNLNQEQILEMLQKIADLNESSIRRFKDHQNQLEATQANHLKFADMLAVSQEQRQLLLKRIETLEKKPIQKKSNRTIRIKRKRE